MNKTVLGVIAAIVIIAAAISGYLYISHKNDDKQTATTAPTATESGDNSAIENQPPPATTNKVSIIDMAFLPATITVKKGTTVTWTNNDSVDHNVIETDGKPGPSSGTLAKDATYSFKYDTVGTFTYHCSIHPDMVGTVIVEE